MLTHRVMGVVARLWVIGVIVSLGALEAGAAPTTGSCDELNSIWSKRFHADLKASWKLAPFPCPSASSAVSAAMHYLWLLKLTPPKNATAPNFYQMLTTPVSKTDMMGEYPGAKPGQLLEVAATMRQDGLLKLYRAFWGWKDKAGKFHRRDTIDQAGLLIHESAHTRPTYSDPSKKDQKEIAAGYDPGHVNCTRGAYKGSKDACDAVLYETFAGSGYNWDFMFFWWMRDGSTSTYVDKKLSRALLKEIGLSRFNGITNAQVKKWSK